MLESLKTAYRSLRADKKAFFAFLISLLILLSIPISVYLVQMQVKFKPEAAVTATLSLLSESYNRKIGETFNVYIMLDTKENTTDGTDVIIFYDSTKLEVQDSDPNTPGVQIQPGGTNMYRTWIGNKVEECGGTPNLLGKITLSGVAYDSTNPSPPPHNPFKGTGTFGIISFKATQPGTAAAQFDFTPGLTIDCNVIETKTSQDVLASVTNASFTITGTGGPTPTPCPTITPTPPVTPTPTPTTTPTPTITPSPTPTLPPGTPTPTLSPTPTAPTPTPTLCAPILGDINKDCRVNGGDVSILMSNWGKNIPWTCPQNVPDCNPDLNGDNRINGADASIMMSNWTG